MNAVWPGYLDNPLAPLMGQSLMLVANELHELFGLLFSIQLKTQVSMGYHTLNDVSCPIYNELELEKAMAPHSSTLAWKIPWTEEPGRLQSMGSLRVSHD